MFRLLIATLIEMAVSESFERLVIGAVRKSGFDDPVYKENVRKLIERNRRFEEARNDPPRA
jgi:hypothetical protein